MKRRAGSLFSGLGPGSTRGGPLGMLQSVARRPITRGVAPAFGIAALVYLLFRPLPGGDSWLVRALGGFNTFQATGQLSDILAQDAEGNNVLTIFADQVAQNAIPAAITALTGGAVYKVGRWLGL